MASLTPRGQLPPDLPFVAIDFETADHGPDSACAVGLVRVERLRVVRREAVLLRPPRPRIIFTHIHGITWEKVAGAPTFGDAWPRLAPILDGAAFLVAHNAPFDKRVLTACCAAAGHPVPPLQFICTVQIARRKWGSSPTTCRASAGGWGSACCTTTPGPTPRPAPASPSPRGQDRSPKRERGSFA